MRPLSLSKPHLIVMVGIPGSGKTYFADNFSDTFNAPFVSYSKIRAEFFPEATYSKDEQKTISMVANSLINELFKTKQTIIYEGATDQRNARMLIARRARQLGYEPLFLWVQTDSVTARKRALKSVPERPGMSSETFDATLRKFSSPHKAEDPVVISGKHTYASQIKNVLKRLAEPHTEAITQRVVAPRRAQSGRSISVQ